MNINGKPVLNGRKKWHLSIDQVDIDGSRRKTPGGCAAARAILRQEKTVKSVRVHIGRTFLEFEDHWERYQTPGSLRAEVIAYDRGGQFMPGEHTIPPLSPSNIAALENGKPTGPKKKKLSRKAKIARSHQYNIHGVRTRGATR